MGYANTGAGAAGGSDGGARAAVVSPTANVEREVKLEVGLGFTLPELSGVMEGTTALRMPDAKLQAIYIDTPDLRLMRWGVTVRHRHDTVVGGTGESGWTVKLPEHAEGVALVRRELFWPGKFGPVPAEVANLVRAYARSTPLGPVAKLTTERRRVELRDATGHRLVEIDDDVVSVLEGRRLAARFREVEVEITGVAPPGLLDAVMDRMTAAGAVSGDDRPKVVRALGPRAASSPDVVVAKLGPDASVTDVVGASIASAMIRVVLHDPGVRLGDDPEHVHQARVGTRRLRSDLRTFASLLDSEWVSPMRVELGWLAAALGEVRDADVLTERLRAQIAALPDGDARPAAALLRRLATQRDEARARMLTALDSDRYVELLDELARAAARPPVAGAAPAGGAGGVPPPAGDIRPVPGRLGGPASSAPPSARVAAAARPAPVVVAPVAAAVADPTPAPVAAQPPAPAPPGAPAPAGGPAWRPGDVVGAASGVGVPASAGEPITSGLVNAESAAAGAVADDGAAPAGASPSQRLSAAAPTEQDGGSEAAADGPHAFSANGAHPAATSTGDRRARSVLPLLVRRPWRHLERAVAELGDDPPDEALHEVRIMAKRLRYAAEASAPVIGKSARDLAAGAAGLQGVLGDMQDAVVAEGWLRQVGGSGSAAQAMVAGQLVTRQRDQQAACRRAWPKSWKAVSKKRLRAWLKG